MLNKGILLIAIFVILYLIVDSAKVKKVLYVLGAIGTLLTLYSFMTNGDVTPPYPRNSETNVTSESENTFPNSGSTPNGDDNGSEAIVQGTSEDLTETSESTDIDPPIPSSEDTELADKGYIFYMEPISGKNLKGALSKAAIQDNYGNEHTNVLKNSEFDNTYYIKGQYSKLYFTVFLDNEDKKYKDWNITQFIKVYGDSKELKDIGYLQPRPDYAGVTTYEVSIEGVEKLRIEYSYNVMSSGAVWCLTDVRLE